MVDVNVEAIQGIGVEPAQTFLWEVRLAAIPGGAGDDPLGLTFRAMSTSIPEAALDIAEINFKGTKVPYAGRDATAKSFDITFFDGTDLKAYKAMFRWNQYCKRHTLREYGQQIVLVLQDRAEEDIAEFRLILAWPSNVGTIALDYAGSEIMNFPVTFSYADLELDGE